MEKFIETLRACPLFYEVADADILKMLGCLGARVTRYGRKSTVLAEGTAATQFGILLSGTVQTVSLDCYGNRSILSEGRPGDLFGEEFACAEVSEMPVTVLASEPSEAVLVDCAHVLRTCSHNCTHHRQMIYNLMRSMAQKNLAYHRRIEITSKRTTREKLLAYLTQVAKESGSRHLAIPFDRQELADYLEVDRSGLSTEISHLRREGVLECHKNHFTLL